MTSTAKQEEQEGFSDDSGSPTYTSTIHLPLKASYILYITMSFMILFFFICFPRVYFTNKSHIALYHTI